MTELEERLVKALALMTSQYIETENGELDHMLMCAGECAVEVLSELGFVVADGRKSRWSEAGLELLRQA